jgi:uncharacterized protein (DUF1778 family)
MNGFASRACRLSLRLTAAELQRLELAAGLAGLRIATFVREAALRDTAHTAGQDARR